jgi:formate/nitrite transporter FocA (FNT family)
MGKWSQGQFTSAYQSRTIEMQDMPFAKQDMHTTGFNIFYSGVGCMFLISLANGS